MATVRDFIEDAFRKISVVGVGENLANEDAVAALNILNDIIGSASVEGGIVYNQTEETFPLVSGKGSYTIGSGGDFDTSKPYTINSVYVTLGSTDYPLGKYDQDQYSKIADKDISGTPSVYYYNNNYPTATITLYPVPSGVSTITMYTRKEISSFASLNDTVDLPAGYAKWLKYQLAVEGAPLFEKEASTTVQNIAKWSKAAIFNANSRNENNVSTVDSALIVDTSSYDVFRGY